MFDTSRLTFFVTFLTLSLWSADAFACKCERKLNPVKDAKMVFWGTATKITPRGAQDRVEFRIDELYKGDERPAVSVYTNRFHHDCGVRLELEKSYVVYAYDFYPRGVATSMCWGTYEAEEAIGEDAWRDHKVEIPDPTELEKKLRDTAKSLVQKCGAQTRVYDAGFSMIMSPDGDPVRPMQTQGGRSRDKLNAFRDCVDRALLEQDDLPRPEQPVLIDGWYQRDVKQLPVLIDQLACEEDCADWSARVKAALTMVQPPDPPDKVSFNLRTEANECLVGGLSAVGATSTGATSLVKRRDRILADCVTARGEFEYVGRYLDQVSNPTLLAALRWGRAQVGGDNAPEAAAESDADGGTAQDDASGSTGQGRAAKVYPIERDGLSFPAEAISGTATPGKFRGLRSGFLSDDKWAHNPLYLEAFAQSVIGDESASPGMLDLAALAYHRAGKLVPAVAKDYESLAAKASDSQQAVALRDEFDKAWDEVHAPPVAEVPDETIVEEEPQVAPEAEGEQDPMLLIVAGILIFVALLGIAAILKRRR